MLFQLSKFTPTALGIRTSQNKRSSLVEDYNFSWRKGVIEGEEVTMPHEYSTLKIILHVEFITVLKLY